MRRGPVVRGRAGRGGGPGPEDFLLAGDRPRRRINPETLRDTWNHGESPERYPVDTGACGASWRRGS